MQKPPIIRRTDRHVGVSIGLVSHELAFFTCLREAQGAKFHADESVLSYTITI